MYYLINIQLDLWFSKSRVREILLIVTLVYEKRKEIMGEERESEREKWSERESEM